MAFITDLLAALGEHLPLLLVGCAEILLAVYLIGKLLWGKVQHKPSGKDRGAEAIFLQEWKRQSEEVCILLRRRDRMPVYTVGNLREVLGVTLTRLREDAASLLAGLDDETERKQRWKTYLDWDGAKPLVAEAAMQNGRWVRFIAHRSRNDNYDLIFGRDITHEHQRLEEDKTKLMQVEEASQSKTTFLSRMSHEIRTPMNGIIGMLALAEGKMQKQDPAMQYLDKANELSAHLLSLINDILDMSRIEAGKVELENKPFSLRAMGDKLYDMFAKTLDARGIRYAVNFEGVTVDWLLGDELRLSQIMINFLSNAVKFTEQGEIVVTIRQMMLREGNVDLLLRVHDTGQGMDPNFVYRIFRPFEQESIETGKKYGGTGLGMAITDQLVHLMGGQILVESLPGKGSDFTVYLTLPQAEADEQASVTGRAEDQNQYEDAFQDCRILMAEDNDINAMIAVELLEGMGAKVDVAQNGQLALETFQAKPEHYYDFILMDVQMPVLDGRAATRALRALNRSDATEIPIFALSADAFIEDERLSMESGMNGHYSKPIDFIALRRNVGAYLRRKETR
ncbi:ATP-binding protein [Evtepia sp.]|uniref:ATP-binding protein n=1 Tax=Evtepia sp. TaxID=2773933 RepID=UPI002E777ED8|nr:ATP-binding protein [Evtepia sp.]MEE0257849.1 ATP-binding protein [Evtepia sp.]